MTKTWIVEVMITTPDDVTPERIKNNVDDLLDEDMRRPWDVDGCVVREMRG